MPTKVNPSNTLGSPQKVPPSTKGMGDTSAQAMEASGEFGFFQNQDSDQEQAPPPQPAEEDFGGVVKKAPQQPVNEEGPELNEEPPKPSGFDFSTGETNATAGTVPQEQESDYAGDVQGVVNKFKGENVTISQSGNEVIAGNSDLLEPVEGQIFQPEMVHIGIAKTINTGNYENVKINVQFSAYVGEETHLDAATTVAEAVKMQLEKLEAQMS